MLQFDNWENVTDGEKIFVDPCRVVSVREYRDRRAYGGFNEVSQILLVTGDKFVVHGHVAKIIDEAAKENK